MSKIIFVDIDGPMIPQRQWIKSRIEPNVSWMEFDAVAVAMLLRLIKLSGAKLVVSSDWKEHAKEAFVFNGISLDYLHEDYLTPRKMSSTRYNEINFWLEDHPEVTHWVAFDDLRTPNPGGILVSFEDGISLENYNRALRLLDVK